jgi:hypothetical protein
VNLSLICFFEPAKDGSAVATACGRDDLGCTA